MAKSLATQGSLASLRGSMLHPVSVSGRLLLAVPFYFLWNWLAPRYLGQAPAIYQHIPFWHCVGLVLLLEVVRQLLTPSAPGGLTASAWWGARRREER